jgi:hypothetical protein
MVPTVSSASNIVFVNGYTKQDGWEVTGLDWNRAKPCTTPSSASASSATAPLR